MSIVEDIYKKIAPLASGEDLKIPEKVIDDFGEKIKEALRAWSSPHKQTKGLRMSNIGKPARQLWFDNLYNRSSTQSSSLQIKFLYGHILEELLLMLVRMSGHKVTDEQKEVVVDGIKGHIDCKIDGEVVDIKSASGFAFSKFSKGILPEDDPFGYISQLTGYEEHEGTDNGGFLVINKETGELCFYQPEELDKPNIKERIKDLKHKLKLASPPELCYAPIPEGKSGNMKLHRNCVYCPHKYVCHKDANNGEGLRTFKYSRGLVHFTKIKKEPKVDEIYEQKAG